MSELVKCLAFNVCMYICVCFNQFNNNMADGFSLAAIKRVYFSLQYNGIVGTNRATYYPYLLLQNDNNKKHGWQNINLLKVSWTGH